MLGPENKKRDLEGRKEEEVARMRGGSEAARRRWGLLARALHPKRKTKEEKVIEVVEVVSVRRIGNFGLVEVSRWGDREDWLRYSVAGGYSVKIRHVWPRPLSPRQLIGFNNTGNLCVWPSEEVLAYYLLREGVLEGMKGKSVLELGGGMTCLAGLFVAKYGDPSRVHLTDGNPSSVDNVRSILEANGLSGVTCSTLVWGREEEEREEDEDGAVYDLVLAADCLFFDDAREDLVGAMWRRLGEDGVALVTAPRRGRTLDLFLDRAVRRGFGFDLLEYYDPVVWESHLRLQANCPHYNPDIHYPVLIRLAKTTTPPLKPPSFNDVIAS